MEDKYHETTKPDSNRFLTERKVTFIDPEKPLLSAAGEIRPEIYESDRLHLNPQGYEIMTKLIAPYHQRRHVPCNRISCKLPPPLKSLLGRCASSDHFRGSFAGLRNILWAIEFVDDLDTFAEIKSIALIPTNFGDGIGIAKECIRTSVGMGGRGLVVGSALEKSVGSLS